MRIKSSEYKRYTVAGPGGMRCPCCVPRSGKRSTAAMRTFIRRQADKREWASFLREQARMEKADAHSAKVEEQARLDAEDELFNQRCQEQEYQERLKRQREQDWLRRLGHGALFWQHSRSDVWALVCVEDGWQSYDAYNYPDPEEWETPARWSTRRVANIAINRTTFEWVCIDWRNRSSWAVPMMDTCLEELQAAAVAAWALR
jgi:hypothetical protein